jgi:predicted transcriptional regulator
MQSRIKELEDSCEELAQETTKLTKEQDEVINRFAAELQREEKAHKD